MRRVPCQGDGPYWISRERWPTCGQDVQVPGTISWDEHVTVWIVYAKKYGEDQSAARIAHRGGFSYWEAFKLLGRKLETWEPVK